MALNNQRNLDYWKSMFPELASHLDHLEQQLNKANQRNQELEDMLKTQAHENKAMTKKQEELNRANYALKASLRAKDKQIDSLTVELNKVVITPVRLTDHEVWRYWHIFCDSREDWHLPLQDASNFEMYYCGCLSRPKYLDDFIVYLNHKLAEKNQKDKSINKIDLEPRLLNISFGALGH